jgi:hypothetical protein
MRWPAAIILAVFAIGLVFPASAFAGQSLFIDYSSSNSAAKDKPKSLFIDPNSDGLLNNGGTSGIALDKPDKEYFSNGAVRAEGFIRNGRRIGRWTFYTLNGSVQFRTEYRDGIRVRPPAQTFKRPDLDLTLAVPAGFDKGLPSGDSSIIGNYYDVDASGRIIHIQIIDVGRGRRPSGFVTEADLKAGSEEYAKDLGIDVADVSVERYSARWKGEIVWGGSYRAQWRGSTILSRLIRLPLSPHQIDIVVAGGPGREAELDTTLQAVLDSLEGRSTMNEFFNNAVLAAGIAVPLLVLAAVVVFAVHKKRRRREAAAWLAAEQAADDIQVDDGRP